MAASIDGGDGVIAESHSMETGTQHERTVSVTDVLLGRGIFTKHAQGQTKDEALLIFLRRISKPAKT